MKVTVPQIIGCVGFLIAIVCLINLLTSSTCMSDDSDDQDCNLLSGNTFGFSAGLIVCMCCLPSEDKQRVVDNARFLREVRRALLAVPPPYEGEEQDRQNPEELDPPEYDPDTASPA